MTSELAAALVKAQFSVGAVTKDAKNDHHGYAYASAEGIIAAGNAALTKAGLALITTHWRFEERAYQAKGAHGVPEQPDDTVDAKRLVNKTKEKPLAESTGRMCVAYLLVHESGATFAVDSSTPVIPDRGRPPDKAEATALTYNLGYTLRGLLLIPRVGEDEQADGRDDTGYSPHSVVPQVTAEQLQILENSYLERVGCADTIDGLKALWGEASASAIAAVPEALDRFKSAYIKRRDWIRAKPSGSQSAAQPNGGAHHG